MMENDLIIRFYGLAIYLRFIVFQLGCIHFMLYVYEVTFLDKTLTLVKVFYEIVPMPNVCPPLLSHRTSYYIKY